MFHRYCLQVIFDISRYILRFIFIILPLFKKILWENVSFFKEIFLYNFVGCPQIYVMMFVNILNFVDIFNFNVQCLLICFCLSFFLKINFHLIASFVYFTDPSSWCDLFIRICLYIHHLHFSIFSIYWWFIQTFPQFTNNPLCPNNRIYFIHEPTKRQ